MSNSIRPGLNGISAVRLSGAGKGGCQTGAALSSLATQIAGHVSDALNLASDDNDGGGRNFLAANDLYEIEELANQLSQNLSGSAADKARLTTALHSFAEQSAALLGARPASYSVQHLSNAIDSATSSNTPAETITSALAVIEQASQTVKAANK